MYKEFPESDNDVSVTRCVALKVYKLLTVKPIYQLAKYSVYTFDANVYIRQFSFCLTSFSVKFFDTFFHMVMVFVQKLLNNIKIAYLT